MIRKLGWLALVLSLAAPATMAWAAEGKAGGAGKADAPACCCCHTACPR
jgi:hypothetical protein